jgi:hypothetical protein
MSMNNGGGKGMMMGMSNEGDGGNGKSMMTMGMSNNGGAGGGKSMMTMGDRDLKNRRFH